MCQPLLPFCLCDHLTGSKAFLTNYNQANLLGMCRHTIYMVFNMHWLHIYATDVCVYFNWAYGFNPYVVPVHCVPCTFNLSLLCSITAM